MPPARIGPALLACLLGMVACRRSDGPLVAVTHLVADRYQRGDPSTANVPSAILGGERRPVLSSSSPSNLLQVAVRPERGDRVTLRVPIPELLRKGPLRLVVGVADGTVAEQKPWIVPTPGREQRVRVTLATGPADEPRYVFVTARPLPEERYVSAPFDVPPAARLRFGIGLDEGEAGAPHRAVEFRVTAVDEGRDRALFRRTVTSGAEAPLHRWSDHEVDLARYAGHRVRLRFETMAGRDTRPDDARIYPLWSDPTIFAPPADRRPFRNAILISLDTLRADHLGCYDYRRPTSPGIDALLAAEGTLFEHAYSHFPGTAGSHMTLLTSLYPCVHGLLSGGPVSREQPRPDAHLLSELLRTAGYRTAAFTEDGWVTAATGFARGFGTFVESTSPKLTEWRGQAETTLGNALAWIRAQRDGPWFAFIHTYQVHHPYTPRPATWRRWSPNTSRRRTSSPRRSTTGRSATPTTCSPGFSASSRRFPAEGRR